MLCFAICGTAIPARASWIVMDEETNTADGNVPQYSFPILFLKKRSLLTSEGKAALEQALPYLRGKNIRVVGKPDAISYDSGILAPLASNRANRIRDWLLARKIPGANITVAIDDSPNPQPNGTMYPCFVNIIQQGPANSVSIERNSKPITLNKPAIYDDQRAREVVVNYILSSAKNNEMPSASALRLIALLSDTQSASPQILTIDSGSPNVLPRSFNAKNIPSDALTRSSQWVLVSEKSVKENLESWAALANYHLKWNAANPYKVGKPAVINGEFLEAVGRVIAATNLVMTVSPNTSTIFINDK